MVTPIRLEERKLRHVYILLVYAPGSTRKVRRRRVARRPFARLAAGDVLRDGRRWLRVRAIECRIERREERVEHVTKVYTRNASKRTTRRSAPANVVPMPPDDDGSMLAQFLRFHVLVRVYDGNPDAWLTDLDNRGDPGGDLRFVRWIRTRLRRDPALLVSIRRMVEATPFWTAAG